MMRLLAQAVTARPVWGLVIASIITLGMASGLSKLQTRTEEEDELPSTDPIIRTNRAYEEVFGKKDTLWLAIVCENVYDPCVLRKVADISEELKNMENVIPDEITSLWTVTHIEAVGDELVIGPLMEEIPGSARAIAELRQKVESDDLLRGRLVSHDGTATLVAANLTHGFDQGTVYRQLMDLKERYSGPEEIHAFGYPAFSPELDRGITHDMFVLLPLSLLLVMSGLYFCFGDLRSVVLPFLTLAVAIVWSLGLMGHLGIPVSVVTAAMPVLMVAVGSSYGVHLLYRYYESIQGACSSAVASRMMVEKAGAAVLLSGVTTVLGIGSLVVFKVLSIREFGIVAAAGVTSTLLVALTVIPALLTILPLPKSGQGHVTRGKLDGLAPLVRALTSFSLAHRRTVYLTCAVVVVGSILGTLKIRRGLDYAGLFPEKHRMRLAERIFSEKLGGGRDLSAMITAPANDGIKEPDVLRAMAEFQSYASTLEGVGNTYSIADVLKRLNLVMNESVPEYNRVPDTREVAAQYLLLYAISGAPDDLDSLVDFEYRRASISLQFTTSDDEQILYIYRRLHDYADKVFPPGYTLDFGGIAMVFLAQDRYIVIGKILNIIASIILVFGACALVMRSLPAGLLSIVPLCFSTLATFGLMGFAGIRLNMATAIITGVSIGVGVDFAIHYLLRVREEMRTAETLESAAPRASETSGMAILYDVISNVLGFSVLIVSGFLPVRNFGWLICVAMISSALGALTLMPALAFDLEPRFLKAPPVENETGGDDHFAGKVSSVEPA